MYIYIDPSPSQTSNFHGTIIDINPGLKRITFYQNNIFCKDNNQNLTIQNRLKKM